MTNDIFGRVNWSALEELRKARRHADLIKEVFGNDEIRTAAERARRLHEATGLGDTVRTALDRAERQHSESLASLNRALAYQDHRPLLQAFDSSSAERARLVADKLSRQVGGTASILQAEAGMVARALKGAGEPIGWRTAATDILPDLEIIRTALERARLVEAATLRASERSAERSVIFDLTSQAEKVHETATSLAQSNEREESERLLAEILNQLGALLSLLDPKTIAALRATDAREWINFVASILGIIGFVLTIYTMAASNLPAGATPSQIAVAVEELRAKEQEANETYVAALPRAVTIKRANIRALPTKDGRTQLIVDAGTHLAIIGSDGRWRHILYLDPLTNQLTDGWIFSPLIKPME